MFHPISATYLDLQEARASAALPAAGAWDAAPTELACPGFGKAIFTFVYTRGAAGGGFDWQFQLSLFSVVGLVPAGGAEWMEQSAFAPNPVVLGADDQIDHATAYSRFTSQGAAAESFVVTLDLDEGVERIRIPAREHGAVGTPGTLQISVQFTGAD